MVFWQRSESTFHMETATFCDFEGCCVTLH